ncbi:MAG: hypothetical protein PWR27_1584 [Petroclostridium sp.]|jgi:sugar phosphate isomerase/epimerase|uniref:sugar phosphate isomerase/epimerase family protein n=1 Tax=Petroclostridium xylanilyticum TaxID=1792311 RepID=UPI000B98A57B|nr:sugar phosphate isomerase/epimerase family protein [Petroclostridium xylanilyticum]MBZ4644601.1 iolE 8 [Clostridia bacterium]MDK2810875.1 hypothetical protein [Petroclostridium sp.]
MKFSVFTVGTPDYNLEETVIKLKEFGYDGVEWRVAEALKSEPDPIPPKERWYWSYNKSTVDIDTIEEKAEYVKSICEKHGMEICALATYLTPDQADKVERVLKAAVIMGCPRIRVNVPGYKGDVNYNDLFNKTISEIKVLEQLAKKYNVKINFEIHMGNIIPSASAAYRLVSNFDSRYIGVIHDAGNMVHEGFEQYKMGVELLNDYLDHVHVKNARWVRDENIKEQYNWKPEWCPIPEGIANLKSLIEALKAIGYDGYLSFEDFSNETATDEKLKNNLEYIKELLK